MSYFHMCVCKNHSFPCSPASSTKAGREKANEGKGDQKDPDWQTEIAGNEQGAFFWLLGKLKYLRVCKVSSTGREEGGVVVGEI